MRRGRLGAGRLPPQRQIAGGQTPPAPASISGGVGERTAAALSATCFFTDPHRLAAIPTETVGTCGLLALPCPLGGGGGGSRGISPVHLRFPFT